MPDLHPTTYRLIGSRRTRCSDNGLLKLLLDACICGGAKERLAETGFDVMWAADWDESPDDDTILKRACREGRVFVTLGKDVEKFVSDRHLRHAGILQLEVFSVQEQGIACQQALADHAARLVCSSIETIDRRSVRDWPED